MIVDGCPRVEGESILVISLIKSWGKKKMEEKKTKKKMEKKKKETKREETGEEEEEEEDEEQGSIGFVRYDSDEDE